MFLFAGTLLQAQAQSYTLTSAWSAANGIAHIANNNNNRGVAYSSVSNEVFVATRSTATTGFIDVFDGTTGTLLSGSGGIAGANLGIDQIGAADDGTLYATPLATAVSSTAGSVTVYAWPNWYNNATPSVAYSSASGDPVVANFSGKRIGDTMAVTGSGANTLILLGIGAQGTNFVLLHTVDGVTFTPTVVFVPTGLPSTPGNIYGITFYTNNTFLVQGGVNATNPSNVAIQHNVFLVSYPANFASQSSVVGTVLGNAPVLAANQTVALNYAPNGQFLAAVETASISANTNSINSTTNFPASAAKLATINFATPNANGNATGGAALGGAGKTNFLYVLESNNGLQAYAISLSSKPVISTAPAGKSGVYPPYTLSASAGGSTPLVYQWLASNSGTNISSTFTNIPGATNTSFTVAYPGTNYFEVIITNALGSVTSAPVRVALLTPVTSPVVTQLWQVPPATYSYLPSSGDQGRGLGYDANSQRLVVASTVGGSGLYILDANTGTNIGTLSLTGVSFGGLLGGVDQVVIADDGVVYAGNLVSGSGFSLFSWPAPTVGATGTQVFSDGGALGGDRWGDTMAVRGRGLNTQILLGSRGGTNVALLTTPDGVNFQGVAIAITNASAGFAANGIAFGAGNTLWAKSYLGHLFQIAFDPVNLVGGVLLDYPNPSKIPSTEIGVGIDPVNNILASIDLADTANDVKLYQLTGTADAPVLFAQSFFASANGNGNDNAAIAMKYPRLFALNVNNGLIGVTYGTPPTTIPTITSSPASQLAYTNVPTLTFSAGVSGSLPIYYQWQHSASTNEAGFTNLTGAVSSTYTLSYPPVSAAGYYRIIAHNIAGYATSAPPALLTLLVPTTSLTVTQLWTVAAGARSYLDALSYNTRGLAYDTNTGILLVADHSTIYLLSGTDGSDLGSLNDAGQGLPAAGANDWLVNQIAVADDGVLYSCNLTVTGPGFGIVSYKVPINTSLAPANNAFGGSTGADPSGTGDRWGDTMSVRGSGVNTEIICGSYDGTTVVVFDTTDGTTFTPHVITVAGVPAGFAGLGIAFGTNNTFWAKGGHNYNLRLVSYDKTSGVGTVLNNFLAGSQVPNDLTGLSVDVEKNILSGVCFNDSPDDLRLYLLSGNTNAPSLFDQAFFGSVNDNAQENAVTTLRGGLGFALDVNNGITAISYGLPSAPAVALTSVAYAPGSTVINWNNTFDGHTYQVQYKDNLLDATWTNLGSPLTAVDATASYTDTTAAGATRFYRVVSQ